MIRRKKHYVVKDKSSIRGVYYKQEYQMHYFISNKNSCLFERSENISLFLCSFKLINIMYCIVINAFIGFFKLRYNPIFCTWKTNPPPPLFLIFLNKFLFCFYLILAPEGGSNHTSFITLRDILHGDPTLRGSIFNNFS